MEGGNLHRAAWWSIALSIPGARRDGFRRLGTYTPSQLHIEMHGWRITDDLIDDQVHFSYSGILIVGKGRNEATRP